MDPFIGLKCNKPHLSKLIKDLMNHTWCAIQRKLCNQESIKIILKRAGLPHVAAPTETQEQHSLEEEKKPHTHTHTITF